MRLVDNKPCHPQRAQDSAEVLGREPFRCDIQEPDFTSARSVDDLPMRVTREHRMQRGCADPAPIQLVYLVLHQRDQRRDHQRRPLEHQRGQLEPE
jgi:hypothetical protein